MIKVSICICTRKRLQGLSRLLASLENLIVPKDVALRIIIVENDNKNYSEELVNNIAVNSPFEFTYYLEPRQGISYARNRAVREANDAYFCCFADDDQQLDKQWLVELLHCQKEFDADGVWGPNPPLFNKKVPSYISNFHQPETFEYGQFVEKGATNCLLIKKSWLDSFEGPFDLRLNFTGGEDTHLTRNIVQRGGIIRYTPYAKAYEIVPDERTTIKYVLKRIYRGANTRFFVHYLIHNNASKMAALPRLFMRFSYGLIVLFPFLLFGGENRLLGLIRIFDALGGLAYIFGSKNKFYK